MNAPSRDLWLVIATACLVGMTISLSLPLLSLVLQRHGYGPEEIGINATANGLGIFLVGPWLGLLLRSAGARTAAAAGMAAACAAMLMLPLQVALLPWYLLRLVISAGTAILFVVSEAAINALVSERHRGRILGLYATLFSIGYAAGPLVVAWTGSGGYLPFLLAALLFAVGIPPILAARSLDEAFAGPGAFGLRPLLLSLRAAPLPFLAILCFGAVESSQFALFPVYALGLGREEGTIGTMLAVWLTGNILLQYPLGWLADRTSRAGVLVLASFAGALSYLLLAYGMRDGSPWPALLLSGGFTGGIYTLSLALLGERFRGLELALANTGFVMMIEFGILAGPAAGGMAMGIFGAASLPFFLAAMLLVLGFGGRLAGTGHRPAS